MTRPKACHLDPHLQRQLWSHHVYGYDSSTSKSCLWSGAGPGGSAGPPPPCHPFYRHLVPRTLSQPGHVLLASATSRWPPRGPAWATCTCRLQELRTELESATPVCVDNPAPGEHRDSGTGTKIESLGTEPVYQARFSRETLGTWVCVSERERFEEPTQWLWGLVPVKVAGQPSSLEA